MTAVETTEQRILTSALNLFLSQGIKKTSLEQVAHRAGVTRVTVYRYFPDKKQLVQAALLQIPSILEETHTKLASLKSQDVDIALDLIGTQFASLPAGDFPALLDELHRVYPELWRQFHDARRRSIQKLFNHLFALAEEQGRLRPNLNRPVVQAYFMSAVVNVLEAPSLVSLGLPAPKIFDAVKAIFLHGILREK